MGPETQNDLLLGMSSLSLKALSQNGNFEHEIESTT